MGRSRKLDEEDDHSSPEFDTVDRCFKWRDILLLASISWNLFYLRTVPIQYLPQESTDIQAKPSAIKPSRTGITSDNSTHASIGFVRSPVIYGHVHYGKTAGTEINGILAAKYDHVCGHKAYSYDFYQFNERVRNSTSKYVKKIDGSDVISRSDPEFNRGRVPVPIMDEIGFEDCDYISPEVPWQYWHNFDDWPLELHVPCRDPIEHLLSACNHNRHTFDCSATNLRQETFKCFMTRNRFSFKLESFPKTTLKCFDPMPVQRYVDYMGNFLLPRRFPTDFQHRESNTRKRTKEKECLTEDPKAAARVRQYLLDDIAYYRWCDQCMGSSRDLFA